MHDLIKFEGKYASAVLAKQMFLWDKKRKENIWLVCAAVETNINLKDLSKFLSVKSGNLRFCDDETLE